MTTLLSPFSEKASEELKQKGLNLCSLLDERAQQQPERCAYQFLHRGETVGAEITYLELQKRVNAIASRLRNRKAAGERALLLFSPGLDFITAFLGCLSAGVTAVPAYPPRKNQKILRLQAIIQDAEATVVLTTTQLAARMSQWFSPESPLGKAQWLAVDEIAVDPSAEIANEKNYNSENHNSIGNPLAFLQYTSGSTGTPKGVMVSHENLLHNLSLIYQAFGHSEQSRGIIWLPPYHDMGLIGGILQPLYGGFPVALMSPVDFLQKPLRWLTAISNCRATTSGGPDFAYDLCVRKVESLRQRSESEAERIDKQLSSLDLSCWKVAFTGAEPIRAETLKRFAKTFSDYGFKEESFYPCYGMAETTLIVSGGAVETSPRVETVNTEALKQHKIQRNKRQENSVKKNRTHKYDQTQAAHIVSCGQLLDDYTVAIVHPEKMTRTQSGEIGEIWLSGPSVAQGYWQDSQKTEAYFNARIAETGEGPFLRTGDLGCLLDGELFVTGRIKDVMIIRGQNFYPQDIERTLEMCHPALRIGASAAFSIEHQGGERLVVVSEVERTYLRKLDVKAVSSAIRQAIAASHNLQVYAALLVKPGSIPKTSSGKIQRYRCREQFLAGDLLVVEEWNENPRSRREFVKIQSEVDAILQNIGAKQ